MHIPRPSIPKTLATTALAAALLSLIAYARPPADARAQAVDRTSPDLLPSAEKRRLSATARDFAPSVKPAAAGPSIEDVGDIDSFGRKVVWLGVTQGNVALSVTCPPPGGDPTASCVLLNPAPAATSFNLDDIAHVSLPGKAAHSLLCYWFSPYLTVGYNNPTTAPAVGRLTYFPTLTIENPVLDDPALIDPMTGLPFGGKLLTAMTSSERFEVPLAAGMQLNERTRDSAVCIAGFLTKRALTDNFGLTDAQAKQFFKKPTTVRLNVSGNVQYVDDASLIFGLRIVGDR